MSAISVSPVTDNKERALVKSGNLGMEVIPDSSSDRWCYRPCIFDEEGREVVRYRPDPCEFKYSFDEVVALLEERAATHRFTFDETAGLFGMWKWQSI